jgi:hypothetical protein
MVRRYVLSACLSVCLTAVLRCLQIAAPADAANATPTQMSEATLVSLETQTPSQTTSLPEASKDVKAAPSLPSQFLALDVSRPFGSRRETFDAVKWAQFCEASRISGQKMIVVQARGSHTANPYADLLLKGAREKGLATAAYVFLNFTRLNETGDVQVREALQAVGPEAEHLKFMVVDVENGAAGSMTQAERVNRIGQAVEAVADAGLRPVIYAKNTGGHRGEWTDLTGGSDDFSYLPLWVPRYDYIASLDRDVNGSFDGFAGWTERAGKQYLGDTTGPGLTGVAVDENLFDRSIVNGPAESRPYEVTDLLRVQEAQARLDKKTGEWKKTITLVNRSKSPIYGPVSLVLDGASDKAELVNKTAETAEDDPYVNVLNKPLAPGKSATITLRFAGAKPSDFEPVVLAGDGTR